MKQIKNMDLATGNITVDENGDAVRQEILMVELTEGGGYQLAK